MSLWSRVRDGANRLRRDRSPLAVNFRIIFAALAAPAFYALLFSPRVWPAIPNGVQLVIGIPVVLARPFLWPAGIASEAAVTVDNHVKRWDILIVLILLNVPWFYFLWGVRWAFRKSLERIRARRGAR